MGHFIAIEGGDGSGKGTHTKLLTEYISNRGKDVYTVSFPQYGKESAYYVERYLNGDYGEANDVPADLAALPFALDRFAASGMIRQYLEGDSIVISDRYMASNLAHIGTRFTAATERRVFYERTKKMEYDILGIPHPALNIVLIMPSNLAQANVDKKGKRAYTKLARDIHEADVDHLERAKANYEELCRLYPDEFIAIQCTDTSGSMRTIEDIQAEIRLIAISSVHE